MSAESTGGEDGGGVSRRRFLAGCGAVGAAAVGTPLVRAADAREKQEDPLASPFEDKASIGDVSLEGCRSIAAFDREFAQKRPQMGRTVNAVDDLGLDPSGKTPINGTFGSAISGMANTRIIFPSDGQFLITDQISARPNGPVVLACNGCSFVIQANTEIKSFVFELPSESLISDMVIDQSNKGSAQQFTVRSKGSVHVKNLTVKGYAEPTTQTDTSGDGNNDVNSILSPIAETSEATVRVTNFTALGGTAAGVHSDPNKPHSAPENQLGSPSGIWVGQSTTGTIQLVNPRLRGWSNGIYGGRTTGKVEILGGVFANNFNANVRVGGGSVVDGTSVLLDDRQWSKKAHPGPYSIGHQGVQALRVDAKHGDLSTPVTFKNLHVVANSMSRASSVIDFESAAGPGIVTNCLIENHLPEPVFQGESPRGDVSQSNILVENCLVKGSSTAGVMKATNRPQSRIQNTCITLPGAGPDDITGMQIGKGVSFGKQCKAGSGLIDRKKIGSAGNLSALPAPKAGYRGQNAARRKRKKQRQKAAFNVVNGGLLLILLLLMGMIAAFVVGIISVIGALGALSGGDG